MWKKVRLVLALGMASSWPVWASAQALAVPVVGFLNSQSSESFAHLVAAFQEGLGEGGYIAGDTVDIEYRWADGQSDRLPTLAAELVERRVGVIFSGGGATPALAAMRATSSIPIVFNTGGDPVALGLVTSLQQPSGNITGINILSSVLEAKRLGLLLEAVPGTGVIAVLLNSANPNSQIQTADVAQVMRESERPIEILTASTQAEIESAFARMEEIGAQGVLVGADPFFNSSRALITEMAVRQALPAIYEQREFALTGGLMSYGVSLTDAYRQGGIYTARILRGEDPANLPVLQSTNFEFVINLKAAAALGLTLPPSLMLAATEFIE